MKKLLFLIVSFFAFNIGVKAIYNEELGTYIADSGQFFSIDGYNLSTWTAKGYKVTDNMVAVPTTHFKLGQHGGALAQCNVGIVKGHKYILTYSFYGDGGYLYPGYSTWKNLPIAIGSHPVHTEYFTAQGGQLNKEVQSVALPGNFNNVYSFSAYFTAEGNGTCVAMPFTVSNHDSNTQYYVFGGYKLQDLGTEPLTEADIQNALNGSFTDLKNSINSSINSSTNSINANINSMKEEQKTQHEEAEETRKGIWGTIKSVLSAIIDLPKLIVNLLIDGLKSLFIPTDDQLYELINEASELSENFGFVGESVSFFINIFTALLGMVNANGCIELPEFSIGKTSLFEAHTFWNAQNVCLGDNVILSANIDTIRTITSIALVCLFINFAASKFFSILSKKDNNDSSIAAYEVGEK